MPTRSAKLKIRVPRGDAESAREVRAALWHTHAFINGAVHHYESLLLEMRQGDVCTGRDDEGVDIIVPGSEWANRLRARLARNGLDPQQIEGALPLFKELYRQMVKSHDEPNKGAGNDGRRYHSLLVAKDSKAGDAKRAKQLALKPLVEQLDAGPEQFRMAAERVIAENESTLLSATGAPNAWVVARKSDVSGERWLNLLRSHVERLVKTKAFEEPLEDRLRAIGAVPLCDPYGDGRITPQARGRLTRFERSALEMAVEHLNQWESWGHRAREQKAKREGRRDQIAEKVEQAAPDALVKVRAFEQKRTAHLATLGELGAAPQYRMTMRELRGWDRLRSWLLEHSSASESERLAYLKDLQRKDPRGFGGEEVLSWLCACEQKDLVEHPAGDVVKLIGSLNGWIGICERTREHPTFTWADPRKHPRFIKLGKLGDDNSPGYRLLFLDDRIDVELELLAPPSGPDGLMTPRTFRMPLAPSQQLRGMSPGEGNVLAVRWRSQDGLRTVDATLQGASLLFDRRVLEQRGTGALRAGALGAVWLKIALDIAAPDDDATKQRRKIRQHLSSSLVERPKKGEPPAAGFRILAVDLGLRAAATTSRFVVGELPGKNAWPAKHAAGFDFTHERSTTLRLPGEQPSSDVQARRAAASAEIRHLRTGLAALRFLRRLHDIADMGDRLARLDGVARPDADESEQWISNELYRKLHDGVELPSDEWQALVREAFEAVETAVGRTLSVWRTRSRGRVEHQPLGGKSIWAIDHLERSYRFLRAWSRRQRPWDKGVRRPTAGHASRLREHINKLRDDRVKTTADLIVQTAMGRVYREGRWVQMSQPVDLIVLEDLNRYRFKTDRPRAENSQLMRWSHRQIAAEVEMQAEIEGIPVASTSAAFTSRYCARTWSPGVRCHVVTAEDVRAMQQSPEEYWLSRQLRGRLERFRIDPMTLRVGDLVPTGAGKLLVTVAPAGGIRVLDADVNAAQGLARRYLDGHAVPFRVTTTRLSLPDGTTRLYSDLSTQKRMQGAFSGSKVIIFDAVSDVSWLHRGFSSKAQAARSLGLKSTNLESAWSEESDLAILDDEDFEAAELEAAEAALASASGERVVLFRDPSETIANGCWMEAKVFWSVVATMVMQGLRKADRIP